MTGASRTWPLPLAIAAAAALGVALIGGTLTDIGPWYHALHRPAWTPPAPAFGLIWTVVFSLTALAGARAWAAAPHSRAADGLIGLFALNGCLNVTWSVLFFQLHRPDWALGELTLLWLSIAALVVICRRYAALSGWLLLPYLAWVTLAGLLNWQVVALNGPF